MTFTESNVAERMVLDTVIQKRPASCFTV